MDATVGTLERQSHALVVLTLAVAALLASPVLPHAVAANAYPSPEAVAREELLADRKNNFADVAATRLTTAQAAAVVLGPVEYSYSFDPAKALTSPTLFSAGVVDRSYAGVPLLLGSRRIAEVGCERTGQGWAWSNTGCESQRLDRVDAAARAGLAGTLGGPPDEIHYVDVYGSSWLLARRGSREAIAFVDYYAYGTMMGGQTPPRLPTIAAVLSTDEFKSLARSLVDYRQSRERAQRRNQLIAAAAVPCALALLAGFAVVVVRKLVRRFRSARGEASR